MRLVLPVKQGLQDSLEKRVPLDRQGQRDLLVKLESWELPVKQVRLDLRVKLVLLGRQDQQDQRAVQEK